MTTDSANLDSKTLLARFSDPLATPEDRRDALSSLSAVKILPKQADDPAITAGKRYLIDQALGSGVPGHRLLAIAECVRLTQIVKRWTPEVLDQLKPGFIEPLPDMQLLPSGDDRLNLARACAQMSAPWLPEYLARSIAEEPTAEKTRSELVSALLERSASLAEFFNYLARAFEAVRPNTQAPGDTMARRLARAIEAVRQILLESELPAGQDLGAAIYDSIRAPLSAVGKPLDAKAQIELSREVLLLIHDTVRTRVSVVADPSMYRVVDYCRKLSGGGSWPNELKIPLEKLITDVKEALILLGRQGQRDQKLLAQLEVLCNHPERARYLAREMATQHPELPEDVRDWLEHGRVRNVPQANESALQAVANNSDESIGLALHAARQARELRDSVHAPLISNLEIYDPSLAASATKLLDSIQALVILVEQSAALRGLSLYGIVGEEIEVSTKLFTVVGDAPRQKMTVRQPAVVRERSDGRIGDVVIKGLVE